ncbi:MAG TPA: glycosyltransferase family 9 protein, partial [Spirochaetota bacterium]|nr:glycosyltransferase family 9 protein [Spirochaetota bacterium]
DILLKLKGIKYGYLIFGNKNKFDYPMSVKLPYVIRKIADVLAISKVNNTKTKNLAIIKLDAIGDYVLFHNFLEILRKSEKYNEYKIILIGNLAWKDIFDNFDKVFVDDAFFINKNQFSKNLSYRYKTLKILNKFNIETSIVPVLSRDFLFYDTIVCNFQSDENISFDSNLSNMTREEKNISNRFYTKIIKSDPVTKFEFERNKEFFEKLLDTKIDLQKPGFNKDLIKNDFKLDVSDYAVIFPGASEKNKIWDYKNFYETGKYLNETYNFDIVICGGREDREYSEKIMELSNNKFTDLTGKTTLTDMVSILSNAKILVSNDTSSVHFGASCNTKTVFMLNGRHFGRFAPYPENISQNIISLYPPEIVEIDKNFIEFSKKYEHFSNLDINSITVKTVKESIDKLLKT